MRLQKEIIFRLTVPKEKSEKERREITKEIIQAHIAQAETFFSTFGALKKRKNHLSLEIIVKDGLILFYAAVPFSLKDFFEVQLRAQYPEVQIEEVSDYNIFQTQGKISCTYLTFRRAPFFPIKTYKKFEVDPLNALTNILSKIPKEDGAAVQIVIRPARRKWHKKGAKIARALKEGKKIHQAIAFGERGPILRGIFSFVSLFSSKETKQKEQQFEQQRAMRLTPLEEELVRGIEEKVSKAWVEANIRVIVSSTPERCSIVMDNIINAFAEFDIFEYGNSFKQSKPGNPFQTIRDFIYRRFVKRKRVILSTEELASIFHLPGSWIETPNILWLQARRFAAPVEIPSEGILLGVNIAREIKKEIHMLDDDRRRHLYIIGKSGTGKSWLLANLVRQDIAAGHGVAVIDPHGDLIEDIAGAIPKERIEDVVYFDPSDTERPMGLNMLEARTPEEGDFAVQEMIAIFYKLFPPEMIGPMFEHNMRNVMLTLMSDRENPGTIAEIPRMFTDPEFQKHWLTKVRDPIVRSFWEKEMAKTSDFHKSEMLGYLISKVGRFVENEMMRNIIGQSHSGFNLREIMDNKKILLVNLAKGKIGEVNSNLLGLILVSKLQMAALARAELPQEKRHDFYLYIDEFQNFITDSIATILAEARKYRLNLIIAHQYLGQLVHGAPGSSATNTKIRDAVLGTVGTMMAFKTGVEDAEIIAKEFAPRVTEYDLINIEAYNAYLKLLVNNQATRPFNIRCLPLDPGDLEIAKAVKELSRLKYGRPKEIVEAEIFERSKLGEATKEWAGTERTL